MEAAPGLIYYFLANRKDGIVQSYELSDEREFFKLVRYEEKQVKKETQVLFTVYHSVEKEKCLGYIFFAGSSPNDGADPLGVVEITNFDALLDPRVLRIGNSTKRDDENQAGEHGEGLKVAAATMMRYPYSYGFNIRSGGFKWPFRWTEEGNMFVTVRRDAPGRAQATSRKPVFSISKTCSESIAPKIESQKQADRAVRVFIGRLGGEKGWDGIGGTTHMSTNISKKLVPLSAFKLWTKSALFLQQIGWKDNIVMCPEGEVVLLDQLRGHVFLKDFLLQEPDSKSTTVRLAYNIRTPGARTDRDRRGLVSQIQLKRSLITLLDHAARTNDIVLEQLHRMLNEKDSCMDISYLLIPRSSWEFSNATVKRLKDLLLRTENAWYHTIEEQVENPVLLKTIRGFGREPKVLEQRYWNVLKAGHPRQPMFRTVNQEIRRRFENCKEIPTPTEDRDFARSVHKQLRALASACDQTKEIRIAYVGEADVHATEPFLSHTRMVFLIPDTWLAREGARKELGLPAPTANSERVLVRLAVTSLFHDLIEKLPFSADGNHTEAWYRKQALTQAEGLLFSEELDRQDKLERENERLKRLETENARLKDVEREIAQLRAERNRQASVSARSIWSDTIRSPTPQAGPSRHGGRAENFNRDLLVPSRQTTPKLEPSPRAASPGGRSRFLESPEPDQVDREPEPRPHSRSVVLNCGELTIHATSVKEVDYFHMNNKLVGEGINEMRFFESPLTGHGQATVVIPRTALPAHLEAKPPGVKAKTPSRKRGRADNHEDQERGNRGNNNKKTATASGSGQRRGGPKRLDSELMIMDGEDDEESNKVEEVHGPGEGESDDGFFEANARFYSELYDD